VRSAQCVSSRTQSRIVDTIDDPRLLCKRKIETAD
jgi:hypothetical protein